jgi:hypothetical protein
MLVDNIKTDLKDIGCEGKDWINVALGIVQWQATVNTVMNLHIP